ncbi:MAG TPA: NAD-dependent epimerase/dehydratase family protein [Acidimicrobiales bacterium]|nr:NAD-dependent epimerase/dehydratase family protein [Acidimicrobiales bacterium]
MGRRVLVTGLSSFWGGRVAQALERDPDVDIIVGLDADEPTVKLERTEFVRADQSYSILSRIVRATKVDTVVHTFLVVDSTRMSGRVLHEINVIGTMNLLAAAGAVGSSVRHLVVKSSALVYGCSQRDPTWFREETKRSSPPRTRVERSLLEVEEYLRNFSEDNPHVVVSLLRFANVLGTDIVTPISKALSMPLTPCIFGFDPQLQFVEEDDVVRSIEYVMGKSLSGVYNVAGDGRLPWSEVAAIANRRLLPLPRVLTGLATGPLGRFGVVDLPNELLDLLRYGRGVDNRRLKEAGFTYRYTSAGAVENFVRARRLRATVGPLGPAYRYERDVEAFFQHSPAVIDSRDQR